MAVPLFNSNGRSTAGSTVEWQRSIPLGQFRRFRRPIFGGGAFAKKLRNEPKASSRYAKLRNEPKASSGRAKLRNEPKTSCRRAKIRNEPKARATRDYYESDLTSSPGSLRRGRRKGCAAGM
jgi:hypothetical protein